MAVAASAIVEAIDVVSDVVQPQLTILVDVLLDPDRHQVRFGINADGTRYGLDSRPEHIRAVIDAMLKAMPEVNQIKWDDDKKTKLRIIKLNMDRRTSSDQDKILAEAETLRDETDDTSVRARLSMTICDIQFKKERWEDAFNAYLRVPVFYGSQATLVPQAELLAARCLAKMRLSSGRHEPQLFPACRTRPMSTTLCRPHFCMCSNTPTSTARSRASVPGYWPSWSTAAACATARTPAAAAARTWSATRAAPD
jgi:hypothetical protein